MDTESRKMLVRNYKAEEDRQFPGWNEKVFSQAMQLAKQNNEVLSKKYLNQATLSLEGKVPAYIVHMVKAEQAAVDDGKTLSDLDRLEIWEQYFHVKIPVHE